MKALTRMWMPAASMALAATMATAAPGPGFQTTLSGAQEVPAVVEDASGQLKITFDAGLTSATVDVRLSDLTGPPAAAHFHCARPGTNGPVAFGLLSPGTFTFDENGARGTISNADFTGNDCTTSVGRPVNNIAALAFAMRDGLIYANVHTAAHPGGEIRGQMQEP